MAGPEDARVTLPGGNGALTRKLFEMLQPKFAERMAGDATIVSVEPQKNDVRITYVQGGALRSVAAKFVIMATPKFITARIVSGLPDAQQDAMLSFRYCPYTVINMIFDRPVYNRAYDTWCPGNSFTDFIVADWVVQKQPGYKQKNNILSFYTPLAEVARKKLLKVDDCRQNRCKRSSRFSEVASRILLRESRRGPFLSSRPSHVPAHARDVHANNPRREPAARPHLLRERRFHRPHFGHLRCCRSSTERCRVG